MSDAVNRERALAVLCDLAFTVGSEVELPRLLTRTLQRFLYHTGYPVGLAVTDEIRVPGQQYADGQLDVVIGDYTLKQRQGQRVRLPLALLPEHPALLGDDIALGDLPTRRRMVVALSLPIADYGHMLLLSPQPQPSELPYTELFVQVLSRLATAIRLCVSYARDVQYRIEQQAYHNALTGLPNAIRFNAELHEKAERVRQQGGKLAVVYLDVDDFAHINGDWGSSGADRLLQEFARRLAERCRGDEFCAHLMADEFAVLLPGVLGRHAVEERVSALLDASRPLAVGGHAVTLGASAGVALYPDDAADSDLVLRYAQMAMHQAKQDARGSYRFFDSEQDRLAHERRSLLEQFRLALENGELRLYYQPKVHMVTGRLVGAEALLRWQDPERGLRLPGDFLGVVEGSDLICNLGRWVMDQALAQARAWSKLGLSVPLSVNIAARHFEAPDFVSQVRDALDRYPDIPAGMLELEILESTAIADFVQAQEVLRACAALGVHTALDDFGTGYSSLAYLSRLPTHTLKVDQTFVRSMFELPTEPAVVRAIVHIAEIFGQHIVAEGVEREEHGLALIAMGCGIAQGYGVARPMPADDFPAWAAAYQPPELWRQAATLQWSSKLYELLRCRYAVGQVRRALTILSWEECMNVRHSAVEVCTASSWVDYALADEALSEALRDRVKHGRQDFMRAMLAEHGDFNVTGIHHWWETLDAVLQCWMRPD